MSFVDTNKSYVVSRYEGRGRKDWYRRSQCDLVANSFSGSFLSSSVVERTFQ